MTQEGKRYKLYFDNGKSVECSGVVEERVVSDGWIVLGHACGAETKINCNLTYMMVVEDE